jgi:hypothetical protein
MALKWESCPDESFKYKLSSQKIRYIHVSIDHALSAPVFYYSLLLNVCDLNANKIFLLEQKGWGGGGEAVWASFTLNTLWQITLRA